MNKAKMIDEFIQIEAEQLMIHTCQTVFELLNKCTMKELIHLSTLLTFMKYV